MHSNHVNILLIKLRHHGDVLLTTPVARVLKEKFPMSQIDLLVYEGTEPLIKNNPDLHHIWSWNRELRGWKSIASHLHVFLQMKKQHYDWVLHLSDQMQGALIAKFLARQGSIGIDYPRRQDIFWRSCFTNLVPLFPSDTHHTVEQNLAVLAPFGLHPVKSDVCCRLEIHHEDRKCVENLLEQHTIKKPYLVVHPTARWAFKCWEEDRFAEVIQHFANQGWPIILTASPNKEEMALVDAILDFLRNSTSGANCGVTPTLASSYTLSRCASEAPDTSSPEASLERSLLKKKSSPQIISLAGQLTLGELSALIAGSRLFLGVDSVPMHIAAALKKDTVALFGPSKLKEWHPWQTRYRLIDARDYGSLLDPDAVNTATAERYLKNIPVAPVIQAVEELLHS